VTSWTPETTAGTAASAAAKRLVLVVGYDGSQPARHALDRATKLLLSREGALEVVYVAQVPRGAALSADALAEIAQTLDQHSAALAKEVRGRLLGQEHPWHFQRRDGAVPTELLAVATDLDHR
jgi:nucleotide-binding universal stress UspA family protein